ncbi:Serine/threonine protein kinase Endoplasmic reticulum [Gracilaria domingensis]|nr:Serine/threonine protein kinase Endoplasmic reticulum [Gracilaria domingensis]
MRRDRRPQPVLNIPPPRTAAQIPHLFPDDVLAVPETTTPDLHSNYPPNGGFVRATHSAHVPLTRATQHDVVPLRPWMTHAIVSAGYVVVKVVSEGSFGTVLKAKRNADAAWVAIKVVKKVQLTEKETSALRRQALVLRTIRHSYIVRFIDDFEDDYYFYHVFEYLNGGDLYDRLESRGKPYTEAQVLFLAKQIFYAVAYLHAMRAAHRDIKLENFVFETTPHEQRQVMKLIDFDLLVVRSCHAPPSETCSDVCGTILYVSPEIASAKEHVPEQSDVWACGVMLYVLLSYGMPFQGNTNREILRAVRTEQPNFSSPVWTAVSPATKQLITDLLHKSGSQRPTAAEALDRVKYLSAQIGDVHSSSRLRLLTKGLRSVSLNLWDPSGNLVRRRRSSDLRKSERFDSARRAHSSFPATDDASSVSSMQTSLAKHSHADSELTSENMDLVLSRQYTPQETRYVKASRHRRAQTPRYDPYSNTEFRTSPALGDALVQKQAALEQTNKIEMQSLHVNAEETVLRHRRSLKGRLGSKIRNWISMGSR